MARYYEVDELRQNSGGLTASAAEHQLKHSATSEAGTYDIFLSHSFRDARLVLGLRNLLRDQGLRVYVDWIDDPQLDRSRVSASTAQRLRERMQQSKSLIYATSRGASKSLWMPWELGYFDGSQSASRISILPVERSGGDDFEGQEYLGLYKVVEKVRVNGELLPRVVAPYRRQVESLTSFANGDDRFRNLVRR